MGLKWDSPLAEWEVALDQYDGVLRARASSSERRAGLRQLEADLDELKITVEERVPPHMKSKELVNVMRWKMLRGTHRPKLLQLITSNSDESVVAVTSRAFMELVTGRIVDAVKILIELRGVGPATASGIAAFAYPDRCAFMSDEALSFAPSLKGKVEYTLNAFSKLQKDIRKKVAELQTSAIEEPKIPPNQEWSTKLVERAIWSSRQAQEQRAFTIESSSSRKRRRT